MRVTGITAVAVLTFLISSPTSIFVSAFALSDISPFIPAYLDDLTSTSNTSSVPDYSNEDILGNELRKRGSCPKNYNSCSTLAAADSGSCCTKNAVCSLDAANQVACCPTGAVCTGTISVPTTTTGASASATTTSSGGFALGGSTASSTTSTTASSTSFTSPTSSSAAQTTGTTTYLTNSYFNFPIIPKTYPNSVACLSAYSACQTNYAHCTEDLQGGSFGVTISAENGGTTVVASTGTLSLGLASATSICSSLSASACWDIKSTECSNFGSASATTTVGFVTGTSGGNAMRIGCGGMMMAAGVGAGVWGGLV